MSVYRKQYRFAMVPEELLFDPEISPQAKALYAILDRHADKDDQTLFPGMARMARLMGLTEDTTRKYRQELEATGWLKNDGQKMTARKGASQNHYTIIQVRDPEFTAPGKTRGSKEPGQLNPGTNESPSENESHLGKERNLSPRQAAGGVGVVSDLFGVPQSLPGASEAEPAPDTRPEASSPAVADPGATATRPARKRDEGWDALAEIEGAKGGEVNKLAAGGIGKALRAIREVCPLVNGELADEIRRRAAVYRATWPNATLSAMALAKHWARMDSAQAVAPRAARDVGVGAAGFAAKFAERVGGGR